MSEVYLLGAGASKASKFCLPTMTEFFQVSPLDLKGYLFRFLYKYVEPFYPPTGSALLPPSINLEDVMTHLDVSITGPARTWGSLAELVGAKSDLENLILQRLSFDLSADPCPLHVAIIRRAVAEHATVLSLNYDLVLEHALAKAIRGNAKPDIFWKHSLSLVLGDYLGNWQPMYEQVGGKYIKLHGAVNWWRCSNDACRNHQQLLLHPFGNIDEPLNFQSRCYQCGYGLDIAIVPPTMKGVFERVPRLGFLWARALQDLVEATRVIVIGVSFPPSDYVLRWLIREAMVRRDKNIMVRNYKDRKQIEVTIVNPDREGALTALLLFNSDSGSWFKSFKNFINGKEPEPISLPRDRQP